MNNKNDMNRINNNINKRLPVILSFDLFLYKKYIKTNNNNIVINNFIFIRLFFLFIHIIFYKVYKNNYHHFHKQYIFLSLV
jgi:hypothetical protein